MRIFAIAAMSSNRVIGQNNRLPWHLPADLKHFQSITMSKPILMGRQTYQSIGHALPGRCNVVITRDPAFQAANCIMANSVEDALIKVVDAPEIFIIGGASLYEQMLPQIQRLYLTIIHHEFEGDTYFPMLNEKEWQEIRREDHAADDKNLYDYSFLILERVG